MRAFAISLGVVAAAALLVTLFVANGGNQAAQTSPSSAGTLVLPRSGPQTPNAPSATSAPPPNNAAVVENRTALPASQTQIPPASAVHWASSDEHAKWETQLAAAQQALRSDDSNPVAMLSGAEAAARLERWDDAASLYARLREVDPTTGVQIQLAMALVRLGRWTEAVPHLREVVSATAPGDAATPAVVPLHREASYNLAAALQAARRINEAKAAWDHVIDVWPENADAHAQRGEVALDLHDWSTATTDFASVLTKTPDDDGASLNLALAQFQLGQFDASRGTLAALLNKNPSNIPAMNRLAELHWTLYRGDPAARDADRLEVRRLCERSLALDANQPLIRALLERAASASASD